jgi:hypothetical protein
MSSGTGGCSFSGALRDVPAWGWEAAVGWAGAWASACIVERRRGGWEDDISGGSSKETGNVHLAPKPYRFSDQGA